ncbi:putative porin [Nibricoccus sp. IMCC34717]|uniref:putative porin n=1 Tax=Nibricoccus sp. IMCC34717 TaxID=3034021 RepID=UPI0038509A25
MLKNTLKWFAVIGGLSLGTAAYAQDSAALINLLTRKGIINDQEAEDLRAELSKEFATGTSAGKLNLSSSLVEFKLSGDVRLRHQMETQAPALATGGYAVTNERTRERFRFRFNGDAKLQKGWSAGFALETGAAADSGNQTLQGGNADYGIYLARAYVGYENGPISVLGGKFKNPIYTTDLRWDADINTQGLGWVYKHSLGGKDTLELRALQSVTDDNNERNFGPTGRDAWLFEQQAVFTKFFGDNSLVIAPGYSVYNQSTAGTTGSALDNENPFNGSTRGLSLVTFAGEYNFAKIAGDGTALKAYWDSSYNLEADRRSYRVYNVSKAFDSDPFAWLVGVSYSYGTGKLQGDYSVKVDYREIGLGAVDPNTSDSDFGFGKLNQRGFKSVLSYNVTDFASANVTYFYTTKIQDKLTNALANLDHSQLLQLDLVVKF